MRDGINLARLGHPTVVLVQNQFARVAREQARALGMPDLRIHSYPLEDSAASPAAAAASAAKVAGDLPDIFRAPNSIG